MNRALWHSPRLRRPGAGARRLGKRPAAGTAGWMVLAMGLVWGLGVSDPAHAQQTSKSSGGIYTCTDAQGRRLTSDRPIAECNAREQRVLNQDGSVRRIVPPTLTPEERAEREAAERRAAQERAAQADAARRDRNLMGRFPDEAAHRKAREAALEPVRQAMKSSAKRLGELSAERRKLDDEAEFYQGRAVPGMLRQQLDANDAGAAALRAATRTQEAELARINALYDAELARLKRLWAGAAPGSLPTPEAPPIATPTSAKR